MLRLGSAILSAVLLGVPRALETRAFGSARSVYVEPKDLSPELAGFAEELSRALEEAGCRLAAHPTAATVVVEVHGLWKCADPRPGPSEAISVTVCDARGRRPLVLHYPRERRRQAARALLGALDGPGQAPRVAARTASA
jgi:hypothetical protein